MMVVMMAMMVMLMMVKLSPTLRRMWLGRGRPLMKTPPSWFMRPCPCSSSMWNIAKVYWIYYLSPLHPMFFYL